MRIVGKRIYHGANAALSVPAIGLVVELGSAAIDIDDLRLGRAVRDVNKAIATLDNAFTPAKMADMAPARSGALTIGEFVAELALVLQRQFVCSAQRSQVTHDTQAAHLNIAFECRHSRLGMLAGSFAVRICAVVLSIVGAEEKPLAALVEEFKTAATSVLPTIETRLLLLEADRRGIPWFRLAENIPVVQLGQGSKRRRFRNSLTDETGDTAYRLSSFKPLGAHLMHDLGLPIPRQGIAETEEQAVTLARRLEFPVVVKPVGMDMGIGVTIGIANETDLRKAYRASRAHGPLQIERHLPGFDYRFTFIRGRLIGVVRTSPPYIEGDGSSTIRQLVDSEPEITATEIRKKVIIDEEVLGRIRNAGYALDDVLPSGERIILRLWWRNKPDHTLANVTTETHPENSDAALLAVQAVGLDVAGVDYITTDISRPFHETGGAFTEVNPMPAMAGVQRSGIPAYPMLLEAIFPGGETGRIDTVVVLGAHGAEILASAVETVLSHAGHQVGIATRARLEVAGRMIRRQGMSEAEKGWVVLRHPHSTAAILQATEGAIDTEGLALERCHIGVLPMPAATASERQEVSSASADEALRLLCAVTDGIVVMDVEDPRAGRVASIMPEGRIFWTESAPERPASSPRRPGDSLLAASFDGDRCYITVDDGDGLRPFAMTQRPSTGDREADRETCRAWLMALAVGLGLGAAPTTVADAIVRLQSRLN